MSKKEQPYEIEQAVFDIDSNKLESATEQDLKNAIQKLKDEYSQKRIERLQAQKGFVVAYKNVRQLAVELYSEVKNGQTTPHRAIESLRKFVNSENLTSE